MKKLLFLLLALTVSAPAFAQTQTQYYTVPTIAALKAMTTSRPAVVQVVDANPGIFNLSSGACSAADDYYQVQPSGGTTVCYTRSVAGFGPPINPGKPDTVQNYYTITSTSGSAALTMTGGSFTSSDVGKLLVCDNIGSTEGRLITSIAGVSGTTSITTAAVATRSVSAVSSRCMYGTDQATNLQTAFTLGKTLNVGSYVQGGVYLTSTALTCLPPATNNNLGAAGPLCQLDPGAVIVAMAPMTAVITYGSTNLDYSGYLRQSYFGGGTIDGNFVSDYGADVPFYNVVVREKQTTKNTKLAGVRYGRSTSSASGGSQDVNTGHLRDILYVQVTSVSSSATAPIVATAWDHGYATGRVVTLTGATFASVTPANAFYEITVTGARTFTLNNTNSTTWGALVGTANVALNMPSMRVPLFISGITNANPAVVTVPYAHGYANNSLVWLADQTGITLGGIYCVKGGTTFTFQLYESTCSTGIDSTSLGTYSAAGTVLPYLDPATVEKFIYYENGIDADLRGAQVSGVRIGIYSNPAKAGYDSKIISPHFYNYNEAGELFAAISMGGDNTFTDVQCDLPIRYCLQLSGPRNSSDGSRMNYASGGILAAYNNYASMVRLDGATAEIHMNGGGMKGDATYAILREVSVNGGSYGYTPGYSRSSVGTLYTSFVQPDMGKSTNFKVMGYSGAATAQVSALGEATVFVYDRTASRGGMYISSGGAANTANFNTVDNTGAYVGTPITLTGTGTALNGALTYGGVTLSNSVTGTGSMVLSASPVFANTAVVTAASGNTALKVSVTGGAGQSLLRFFNEQASQIGGQFFSGASGSYAGLSAYTNTSYSSDIFRFTASALTLVQPTTMSAALTYGGVTLSNNVTGTGSMVLSSGPALASPTITGNVVIATGQFMYATGGTGTVSAGVQFDGTGNAVGFYSANTFRGAINSAGTLAMTGAGTFGGTLSATLASTSQTNVACYNSGTGLFTYQTWATGCLASSARFKENVTPKSNADALKVVTSLEPVKFQYKASAGIDREWHNGFIAEQVVKVAPDLVSYDADGKTPRAVKYQELAPYFAGAIRELKAANDNLKAEIAELKKKVK